MLHGTSEDKGFHFDACRWDGVKIWRGGEGMCVKALKSL